MRLIDADALIKDILALPNCPNGFSDTYDKSCIIGVINEQPTIEPERKKGKWLFPYGDKKYKRCSVCERDYYSIPHNSNFCPNCGCLMKGDSDSESEMEQI